MEAEMLCSNDVAAGTGVPGLPLRPVPTALSLPATVFLSLLPIRGHAASLVCPEMGRGAVRDVLPDSLKLVSSANTHELSNEIRYVVNQLQIEHPNISY